MRWQWPIFDNSQPKDKGESHVEAVLKNISSHLDGFSHCRNGLAGDGPAPAIVNVEKERCEHIVRWRAGYRAK